MRKRVYSFIVSLFIMSVSNSLIANEQWIKDIRIDTIKDHLHLAKYSLIVEDEDHSLSVQDLITPKPNFKFKQPTADIPYMDFTASTYWMILSVKNEASQTKDFYVELARPLTNLVELFVIDSTNSIQKHLINGDDFPFHKRSYLHRKFIIPFSIEAKTQYKLIVKAKSDGEILKLPVNFWKIDSFTYFASIENFFLGLYYGFIGLVFILFSFFGYALRQKIYVLFVAYVFVLGCFQFALDGFAFQFFWPSSPWMGNHAILIFASISALFLLGYADQLLEFYKSKKIFYNIYKLFYLLVSLCLISSFTNGSLYALTFPVLNGLSFLMICYFFIGIYIQFKAGYRHGISVTLAFAFLWLGAIFFILSNVDIIDSEFLAANALKLGSAAEITFLSVAMANRYQKTQKEKLSAQREALSRLEEINQLKDQQTEKLEKEVQERTLEISRKNKSLSTKNEEIINSITYAKRLQSAILPSDKLLEALFMDFGILYLPKDIVSGDFYWVETTNTHTFFAVADCTGHGVPGAMVSVVGYNALNRCVNEIGLVDPGKILDRLRDIIEFTFTKDDSSVSDGMDICLCVWDNQKTLQYAGAFNPLYLLRNNEIIEIKGDKQPVGRFIQKSPFTTHEISLHKGDSIYLFSDGYADQFGGSKGKKLKYSSFKDYLLAVNSLSASEAVKALENRFHDWKGTEEQIDDVCLMNIRF